jgi:hypothetical protein
MTQKLATRAGAGVLVLLPVVLVSTAFDGAAGGWDLSMLVAGLLCLGLTVVSWGRVDRGGDAVARLHGRFAGGELSPSVIYGTRAETGARCAGRARPRRPGWKVHRKSAGR